MNKSTLTALALILPLAACGGSGSDPVQDIVDALIDGSIDPSVIPALADAGDGDLTVAELEDAAEEFEEEFGDLLAVNDFTDLSSLPTEGTAQFAGVFGLGISVTGSDEFGTFVETIDVNDVIIAGEMSLDFDLDSNALSGDVSNLQYVEDGEEITGSLAVSANLDRTVDLEDDFGIVGGLSGDLSDTEGDFSIEMELVADLYGENAEAISGEGFGLATNSERDIPVAAIFGLVNQGALD